MSWKAIWPGTQQNDINVNTRKTRWNWIGKCIIKINLTEIKELNELIYPGAKQISDKTDIPHQKNPNNNTKPGWEIRLERQLKKLS